MEGRLGLVAERSAVAVRDLFTHVTRCKVSDVPPTLPLAHCCLNLSSHWPSLIFFLCTVPNLWCLNLPESTGVELGSGPPGSWLVAPSCRPSRYFLALIMTYNIIPTYFIEVLNVAEKNDAAKNIASIMSGGAANRREGFSPYNKIYEYGYMVQVNFDWSEVWRIDFQGQQANMVMTSLSGHLLNMEFAPQYKKWWVFEYSDLQHFKQMPRYSCNPIALFEAPMVKGLGEGNSSTLIKKTLQKEVKIKTLP